MSPWPPVTKGSRGRRDDEWDARYGRCSLSGNQFFSLARSPPSPALLFSFPPLPAPEGHITGNRLTGIGETTLATHDGVWTALLLPLDTGAGQG